MTNFNFVQKYENRIFNFIDTLNANNLRRLNCQGLKVQKSNLRNSLACCNISAVQTALIFEN